MCLLLLGHRRSTPRSHSASPRPGSTLPPPPGSPPGIIFSADSTGLHSSPALGTAGQTEEAWLPSWGLSQALRCGVPVPVLVLQTGGLSDGAGTGGTLTGSPVGGSPQGPAIQEGLLEARIVFLPKTWAPTEASPQAPSQPKLHADPSLPVEFYPAFPRHSGSRGLGGYTGTAVLGT